MTYLLRSHRLRDWKIYEQTLFTTTRNLRHYDTKNQNGIEATTDSALASGHVITTKSKNTHVRRSYVHYVHMSHATLPRIFPSMGFDMSHLGGKYISY